MPSVLAVATIVELANSPQKVTVFRTPT